MSAYRRIAHSLADRLGWIASGVTVASIAAVIWFQTSQFSGRTGFALYPLDDSYIHLALARTLAQSGDWGVTPGQPAAASSSPLFTLLLFGARRLISGDGPNSWVPLVVNTGAAVALIGLWRATLRTVSHPAAALLALILALPLPALAAIGMEHVIHCLLSLVLALSAARSLATPRGEAYHPLKGLGLAGLAGLAVAARYESLFLVAAIMLLALARRRIDILAWVSVGATAPVIGFGVVWIHAGGWLLPNALLVKTVIGGGHDPASLVHGVLANIKTNLAPPGPRLLRFAAVTLPVIGLPVLLAIAMIRRPRFDSPAHVLAVLAILSTIAQVMFASLGWLYRYEAWLINLDLVALVLVAESPFAAGRSARIGMLILVFALVSPRAWIATSAVINAAKDRRWEHFAVAERLGRHFPGENVLVNDIGVMAYLGLTHPVDVFGLADNLPIRYRRAGVYGPAQVLAFARARDAHIGVLKLCWTEINRRLPPGWTLVEVWQGPHNVAFGDVTVGFFAETPTLAARLAEALQDSPPPAGVDVVGPGDPRIVQFNAGGDPVALSNRLCVRRG